MYLISEASVEGEENILKVRLSTTNKDVKLTVRSTDTIATAKRKLDVCIKFEAMLSLGLLGTQMYACK